MRGRPGRGEHHRAGRGERVPDTDRSPEGDGTLAWRATTLVVVTVTAGDTTGTGWTYAPAATVFFVTELLTETIIGSDVLGIPAHCAPNLHLPAAAATVNLRHIEWFHDHQRIESTLFDGAADSTGGQARPHTGTPGHGLALRTGTAQTYRVA
ncbi:hypothetical protein ACWDRB_48325 [Nonomuraea sp. NPDC003707]